MTRRLPSISALLVASRVAASLVGGWVFVWGFVTLGVAGLLRAGMSYEDALTLCNLLAFLVFLGALCWAFAAASVARVWGVLLGGGGLMTALSWWLLRPAS